MGANDILDGIRIASPCPMSWDAMEGDDRVRFCSGCSRNVYNLASMTTPEALALIGEREGAGPGSDSHPPCLRLHRRADGTTITADCPVGARASRGKRLRRLAGFGIFASAFSACVAGLGFMAPASDSPQVAGGPFQDWADQVLIRLGLRKPAPPAPSILVGKICAPPSSASSPTTTVPVNGGVQTISADQL